MSTVSGTIAFSFGLVVFLVCSVAIWLARPLPRITLPQHGVRFLYWLATLIQAYAVAWDSAIIAYRDYMIAGPIRPRNEFYQEEELDGATSDRS